MTLPWLQLPLTLISHWYVNQPNNINLAKTKKSLLCTCGLLLLWQLVGALLYTIRDVACFRVQSTAYRCKKDTYFPFSEELTIVWLASLCICIAIFVVAFRNVPQFPGYEAILYKLMFVPSFSTLVLLLTLAICRYIKLFIYIESSESRVIIFFLKRSCVLRTLAVGFLNYTRFNFLEKNYHNVCVYKQFV